MFLQYIFINIQILYYSISVILLLKKHKKNIGNYYSNYEQIKLNWISWFVGFLIIAFLWNIYSIVVQTIVYHINIFYILKFVYVFILGFFGFKQKDIYDNCIRNNNNENDKNNFPETIKPNNDNDNDIINQLIDIMNDKKVYLNPDLRLNYFSEQLHIHKNTLSYIINNQFNMNFYNWVNSYRIHEARQLLDNKEYSNYSIEAIMQMAGFKSKSVFNPLFKKTFGKTPSEYLKTNNKSV